MRISNKKVGFHYEILEKWEAGLVLLGSEVKSLRQGRGSLVGSFVSISEKGVPVVKNFQIPVWEFAREKPDPLREKPLLLHKRQIAQITKALQQKGMTLVPLSVFFQRGFVKMEVALARGKKKYDQRKAIKERDLKKHISETIKRVNRQ